MVAMDYACFRLPSVDTDEPDDTGSTYGVSGSLVARVSDIVTILTSDPKTVASVGGSGVEDSSFNTPHPVLIASATGKASLYGSASISDPGPPLGSLGASVTENVTLATSDPKTTFAAGADVSEDSSLGSVHPQETSSVSGNAIATAAFSNTDPGTPAVDVEALITENSTIVVQDPKNSAGALAFVQESVTLSSYQGAFSASFALTDH